MGDLIEGYPDFAAFYAAWRPRAEWVGRRCGVADPEAFSQDVMEVFYRTDYLARHAASGSQRSAKSWINAVIYRRAYNAVRDQNRRPVSAAQYSDEIAPRSRTSEFMGFVESRDWVLRVRDVLSEDGGQHARVWDLCLKQYDNGEFGFGGRMSAKVLADDLGVSVNTARRRIRELRSALEDRGLDRELGRRSGS